MKQFLCLNCQKQLHGRSDKKYCDMHCKSMYHNKNKAKHELSIQSINSILRKNRSILSHFCPVGKATVRKNALEAAGFQFHHFTGVYKNTSTAYYFCYDYGFAAITQAGVQKVVIVQKQDYIKFSQFNPWNVKSH